MGRKKIDFDCPWSVEDNLIKDHVGGSLRKEWLLKGSATLSGAGAATVTISSLSGALVTEFDDYFVLVQKLLAAPVIVPKVDFKTSKQFRITGDAAAVYSITVLGYEKNTKKTGKWANQYCEYCKVLNLKTLIGSVLPGQVVASYAVTCDGVGAGLSVFQTVTQATGRERDPDTGVYTYKAEGTSKPYGLKKMKNVDYSIFLTPIEAPGTAPTVGPSLKSGFGFTAGANLKYDVIVFGEIEQ